MKKAERHFPYIPDRLKRLEDLAYNLWFSWNADALWLFRRLDRKLWEDVYHNPVRLLHEMGPRPLDKAAEDPEFLTVYDRCISYFDNYMNQKDTWFNRHHPGQADHLVAYFSMEFGFHECLPIYSGGLGILAGDHLKTASDMGIPLVGVGLLYRESYFTQYISLHGHQQAIYMHNDFSTMAVEHVYDKEDEVLIIHVPLDHRTVAARLWRVNIGRVTLFLLDTDFHDNPPEDREITERLYVDDRDMRLIQEMLLGIGGVRALDMLGYEPKVWHMNEGHSTFLGMERMRRQIQKNVSLEKALQTVKSSTVFTTHTPIPAGNEVFEAERIDRFMKSYWESMKITREDFFAFGQKHKKPDPENYNMTVSAIKLSAYQNGVSELHAKVSQKMWQSLWPDIPAEKVPIMPITNGIHTHTWMATQIKNLLNDHLGDQWRYELLNPGYWDRISNIPDETLWKVHIELKKLLIDEVRTRLVAQRERNGESKEAIREAETILDPEVLTIGFARRFAPYKRATLAFRDRERLKHIITQQDRPVQLLFAGKSHPANQTGKGLIQQIYGESRNPEFNGHVLFVENYDMALSRRLLSGVDVWMNLPRRPMEASGTSGMKAVVNGVLNLSVLDGWWPEGYNTKNGWAVGEEKAYYSEFEQDEADGRSLYEILEHEIIPMYYNRDEKGVSKEWMAYVKESMRLLIPRFNTYRMLEEYLQKMYLPVMK